MKLYYSPGACSMAPHIVALEAGLDIALEKVDLETGKTAGGVTMTTINPKGYVPTLQLDNGEILTEGPIVSVYLADQKPESGLAPAAGSLQRYRMLEMFTYINSELHKNYSPLFNPATTEAERKTYLAALNRRFAYLDGVLAKQPYLLGANFSAVDAYLFTVLSWAGHVKLDLSSFTHLHDFKTRVATRPAVQRALRAEGLIH